MADKYLLEPALSLTDNYPEVNSSGTQSVYNEAGGTPYYGQSFIAASGNVSKVTFYLNKSNNPTGYCYAQIYAHSGTYGVDGVPTGSALATSEPFDLTQLSTTATLYDFYFRGSNFINLTSLTPYFVVFYSEGGSFAAGSATIRLDSTSSTHSGNAVRYPFAGPWSVITGDLIFYVYQSPTTTDGYQLEDGTGNLILEESVTTTGQAKVWTGATWAGKPVKVWSGSTWQTKPVKSWTGSTWTTTTY